MSRQNVIVEATKYCKAMIIDDINAGLVPDDIASFHEIHDYVDGNEYFIEALGTDIGFDELIEIANEVQAELDKWIKAGI